MVDFPAAIPLLAIQRLRCPKCQARMTLARILPGPSGFELRTFDCSSCDHVEKIAIASDPTKSGDVGWLVGEFESGKVSRRQLVQTLALLAGGLPIATAVANGAAAAPTATSPTAPWKTVWLDHISFRVSDYKKSVDFYTNLMGWQVKEDTGTQAVLDINGIGGIIIRNGTRGGTGDVTGVIDHISWGVEPWDTNTVKAELEKRHLEPRPDMVDPHFKSFHVKDPDGWDLQISNQTKAKHD
jgi:catechol 2,3-dioxygenase-like lactoylglutathione lyase family enzyme